MNEHREPTEGLEKTLLREADGELYIDEEGNLAIREVRAIFPKEQDNGQ